MDLKCLRTFVTVFLFPLGIVEKENAKYKRYEFVFFLLYYTLVTYVTFGIVVGLVNTTDVGGIGLQIGQLTTHMTSLMMTLYYKFRSGVVLELISKLRRNGTKWTEAGGKMERFIGCTVLNVFCGYYGMIVVVALPVFIGIPAARVDGIDQKGSFLIPFWYYCGDETNGTGNRATDWVCWKVDSVLELAISNGVQTVLYMLTLHALIMYLLFYTILTTNVKVHAEVLNDRVAQMAEQWLSVMKEDVEFEASSAKREREVRRYFGSSELCIEFDDILKHQQFIRGFTKEVTELVQWMVMINMMGIFSSLTLTIFFTIVEKTNDSGLSSKLANMSIIMIITFFIYCYNAQTITDLNQRIFESMLEIPWYRRSISFRQKYAIALCLNTKPINVKACKMYDVNLPLFLSFMKGIYSVINIMLVKYSKK